jgi:basic amino acid/polyamine antiporter, APA family
MNEPTEPGLQRHFGLLQATALNVTMIVGAGVFLTIPYMLQKLNSPFAILGWVLGGALICLDGLVWAELGAALPGSGGSYLYLLECYGRTKWGRPLAFLFIWQFLISGPLELASGLGAIALFSKSLTPEITAFNKEHAIEFSYELNKDLTLKVGTGPTHLFALALGALVIFLLYRRISSLGKLTVTFWLGVLAIIAWILFEGFTRGQPMQAFALFDNPPELPRGFWGNIGPVVTLAIYSYLGYYNVCYIGDEVKSPGRTIPRAIILSAVLVAALFVALHVAMLGVVPWNSIPTDDDGIGSYSLPAEMMKRLHDNWAVTLITLMLIWSCFGSAFAGMLGYARIPYGAAKEGHFYSALAKVHPTLRIPHVALLLVGVLTLFWSFFDLGNVIFALVITRIMEQFVAQIVGVMILRKTQPDRPRPYRIWLYPLPCLLALIGWLALYATANPVFILLGLGTLAVGVIAFLLWSWRSKSWPFAKAA